MSDALDRVTRATTKRANADEAWKRSIRDAHASGLSLRAIAEIAGVSHVRVLQIARDDQPARKAKEWAVYRMFDGDELLYVGMSSRTDARLKEHRGSAQWWDRVTRTTLEHFETKDEAMQAERAAILAEDPPFNARKTPTRAHAAT